MPEFIIDRRTGELKRKDFWRKRWLEERFNTKLYRRVTRDEVFRKTWDDYERILEARTSHWTRDKRRKARSLEKAVQKAIWGGKDIAVVILKAVDFELMSAARKQERKWLRSTGLSTDDFASMFREEVFRLAEIGDDFPDEFYIIETLELAWKRRALDLVRSATTEQRKWERGMEQIDAYGIEHPDRLINVEQEAINLALMDDPALTEEERRLLHVAYIDPKSSNQQLADMLGYYPEKVRRMKKRIGKKISG